MKGAAPRRATRVAIDPAAPTQRRTRRRGAWGTVVILLVLAAGVVTMLYPVVATGWNDHRQQVVARAYADAIRQADPKALDADIVRAQQYNTTLRGAPILDPYVDGVALTDTPGYRAYLDQLNDTDVMARIRVPSARIDLPVRHGTAPETIAVGAGHLYGTSLPVGGDGTHAVITSHTGMPNATLFDNLVDVLDGDLMFVDVAGQTLAYQVDDIRVVQPADVSSLKVQADKDLLTLFTCTPYGVNTHRLLVTGHRIPYDQATDRKAQASAPQWRIPGHMLPLLAGSAAGLVLIGGITAAEIRSRRKTRGTAPVS